MYLAVADALGASEDADDTAAGDDTGKPDEPGTTAATTAPDGATDRSSAQSPRPDRAVAEARDTTDGQDDAAIAPQGQLAASAAGVASLPDGSPGLLVLAMVLAATAATTFRLSRRR